MSMGTPENPSADGVAEELDEEIEEINVEITEDNMIWLHGADVDLVLSPIEARELADALREVADEVEAEPEGE